MRRLFYKLLAVASLAAAVGAGAVAVKVTLSPVEKPVAQAAAIEPAGLEDQAPKPETMTIHDAWSAGDDRPDDTDRIRRIRDEAARHVRSGEIDQARELLSTGIKLDPQNPLLLSDMSRIFTIQGWRELEKSEYRKSRGFFEEAMYYWPDNLEAMRGMAYALYQEREQELSEKWLKEIVARGGDRPEVYTMLGRLCYQDNRLAEALQYFQLSLALSPEQPDIQEMADKLRLEIEVERNFGSYESRHFLIRYEGRENPEAAFMVERVCEEAYIEVGRSLGFYPVFPVTVILYTERQFQDVTKSPAWAGAIFDGKIRIPARGISEGDQALNRIIRHEFTHALVHEFSRGKAPVWLHEGVAQMMEGSDLDPWAAARKLMDEGGPLPLAGMEGEFVAMSPPKAQRAYLQSRLAALYIREAHGPHAIRELLRYLGVGENMEGALRRVTGGTYRDLDEGLARYLANLAGGP